MSLVPLYWGVPGILVYLTAAAYKPEWIRYALAVSACLFAIAWSQVGKASGAATEVGTSAVPSRAVPAAKSGVLDADKYQEFPLSKKTVISSTTNPKSGIKAITSIYRFTLPNSTDQLGLPIGQHISLAYDIVEEGKPKVVARSYTPISSDNDRGYVDLLIKAYYPVGNLSKYVDQLKIGDTIKIRGPKGAMKYHSGLVKRFGMIAGGTGITPMLQIIQAIRRGRPKDTTEVDLIYANQTAEDILLKDELDTIAKEDPKIRIHYVLEVTPEGWTGGKGFVTADMIKEKLPAPSDDMKILLCGPPPMITAMKKNAESLGFAKARAVSKLEDQVFCF